MKEACRTAQESIDFEQYIFEGESEIGKEFISIFKQKLQEGVRIRLLVDMVGGFSFWSSPLPDELRELGAEIVFFNTIRPWRIHTIFSWFFRDHRKILVIDKKIAFIGGVGVHSDMTGWRDTHLRLEGKIVEDIHTAFEEMLEVAKRKRVIGRSPDSRAAVPDFRFVTNAPHFRKRFLYREVVTAMRNASRYIYITTPYFIPDRRMWRILRLARQRGVTIKVLVPESSDHLSVDRVSHSFFDQCLRAGIEIYQYRDEMIHAKTIVIDDEWATVGSFNLDNLSFFYNFEANVISLNREFAEEVRRNFEADLQKAERITLENWRKRPLIHKLVEKLFIPARRFF